MVGDNSDDDVRSPTIVARRGLRATLSWHRGRTGTRILRRRPAVWPNDPDSSRTPGQLGGRAGCNSAYSTKLARGPQYPGAGTTVRSQHFSGTRERAASRSRALRVPTHPERCAQYDAEWATHLDQAAHLFSCHKRVPYSETRDLLHLWWSEVTEWVCDRPDFLSSHINRDLSLAELVLHHLATSGPPDSMSSPHLGSKDDVTLETAAKGIGPAGSVHVP